MSEEEFRKFANEYGYSEEEIQDLVDLHNESGIEYQHFVLEKRRVEPDYLLGFEV